MLESAPPNEGMTHVATFQVTCAEPECPALIDVGVLAQFIETETGWQLALQPELTDTWAHYWTHGGS
jgi:hypothetical protein